MSVVVVSRYIASLSLSLSLSLVINDDWILVIAEDYGIPNI